MYIHVVHYMYNHVVCVWYAEHAMIPVSSLSSSSQCVFMCAAGVPLTPSNVMRALWELKEGRWWVGGGLGDWLFIPRSKRTEIRQKFPNTMDQKKQCIYYWMQKDPLATWRRLINSLYEIRETKLADSIRSNAEPLTGIQCNYTYIIIIIIVTIHVAIYIAYEVKLFSLIIYNLPTSTACICVKHVQ